MTRLAIGNRRRVATLVAATAAVAASTTLVAAGNASARPACDATGNPCPTGPKTAPGKVDVNAGYTLTVRRAPRSGARKVRNLRGRFSDGGHWDDNARALGFRVNNRPASCCGTWDTLGTRSTRVEEPRA